MRKLVQRKIRQFIQSDGGLPPRAAETSANH